VFNSAALLRVETFQTVVGSREHESSPTSTQRSANSGVLAMIDVVHP
jgi:hypothetical protein